MVAAVALADIKSEAGSDRGGESTAAIYNLIGTVKPNGIGPGSYLRKVPFRISITSRSFPWSFPAESAEASTCAA